MTSPRPVSGLLAALALLLVLNGCGQDPALRPDLPADQALSADDATAVEDFVLRAYGADSVTLAGAFNGWVIATFKIPDFIATLGTMTIFRGAALLVTDGLPVPSFDAQRQLPDTLIWVGGGTLFGFPVSALLALLCGLIAWYVLRYTVLGRAIYAVGGNREAARVSGISIERTKIMTYAISGLLAAIAGIVLVGRLNSANALMAEGEELRSIASVVIGGTNLFGGEGSVLGSIVGAAIIGVLGNGLNLLDVSPFWQRIAQGFVIVVVVIFDQWRRRSMTRI